MVRIGPATRIGKTTPEGQSAEVQSSEIQSAELPSAPPSPRSARLRRAPQGAAVLTLARPVPFENRFTVRDRITLAGWAQTVAPLGITRLRLEEAEPGDDEQVGSFALIYRDGGEWARWGLARLCDGSYMAWLMASGAELGTRRSLEAALLLLLPAARRP